MHVVPQLLVSTILLGGIYALIAVGLTLVQLVAFAVAVLCTAALFAFMRWSYTGKVMRATAQDRAVASLMGIDTGRVFALTWAVGVTCVGVAGVLLAPIYPVYPTVGLQFVLIAYVAVVLGGLGDMAGALLGTRWGLSPWIGLLVGAALATAFGILIGFLSNRLRGPYFVLATIAFSQVLLIVASRWRGFTSGSEGIPVPFRPGFWTLGITDKRVWVAIVLALAIFLYLVELYLERSRRGYQLAAVREDEDAALSLGVPALRLKVAAIAASAALTAVAGALWAQYVGFVDPFYVFSVDLSVRFALATIIGGIGTALGPFIGAALILTLETYLRARFGGIGASLVGIYLIIYGTALVVMMRFAPQGLVPWLGERFRRRPVAGSTS